MLEAIGRVDRGIAWALRSFAGAHPWLTAPVIVVTAVAISGSAASVVLLCRVRPRLRGPVAAASGAPGTVAAGALAGAAAAALTWRVSGLGWVSTLLTAAERLAARLGARIRRPAKTRL